MLVIVVGYMVLLSVPVGCLLSGGPPTLVGRSVLVGSCVVVAKNTLAQSLGEGAVGMGTTNGTWVGITCMRTPQFATTAQFVTTAVMVMCTCHTVRFVRGSMRT